MMFCSKKYHILCLVFYPVFFVEMKFNVVITFKNSG